MDLNKYIDHTLLKPNAVDAEIITLCKEAKEYHFASVCVNPCNVALVKKELSGSDVMTCSVIGFPFGTQTTAVKCAETEQALKDGACEIDMVINVGKLLEGADFIKTSTGYGSRGASLEDIALFKKYLKKDTKIKASGGIRSREDALKYIEAGCSRIGTRSGIKIIKG